MNRPTKKDASDLLVKADIFLKGDITPNKRKMVETEIERLKGAKKQSVLSHIFFESYDALGLLIGVEEKIWKLFLN